MVLFEDEEKEPESMCLWGCYFHFIAFSPFYQHSINAVHLKLYSIFAVFATPKGDFIYFCEL